MSDDLGAVRPANDRDLVVAAALGAHGRAAVAAPEAVGFVVRMITAIALAHDGAAARLLDDDAPSAFLDALTALGAQLVDADVAVRRARCGRVGEGATGLGQARSRAGRARLTVRAPCRRPAPRRVPGLAVPPRAARPEPSGSPAEP
jgi:hypothetical protein